MVEPTEKRRVWNGKQWTETDTVLVPVRYGTQKNPQVLMQSIVLQSHGVNNAPPPYEPSPYLTQKMLMCQEQYFLGPTFLRLRYVTQPKWDPFESVMYAEAYKKLRSSLYSGSISTLVDLGELWQTHRMLRRRLNQVLRQAERLTGRVLRTKPSPAIGRTLREARYKRVNRTDPAFKRVMNRDLLASSADNWLETIFGWVPLMHDVCNGLKLLGDPIPDVEFTKSSKRTAAFDLTTPYLGSSYGWKYRQLTDAKGRLMVRVSVDNPNLWLAEKSGSLNLALAGWDLVPWSFAIDWVVNVSSVLGSITDFAGLRFHEVCWSTKQIHTCFDHVYDGSSWRRRQTRFFQFKRNIYPAPPTPKLVVNIDNTFRDLRRSITAAALIVQQMYRLRRALWKHANS